jgi:hypothetical protein
MAGGIFVDQPFYFNPKCVVFGIFLMGSYWFLPYRNPFLLPVIFAVGYMIMAWYDYLYNCDLQMYSGSSPLGMATIDAWGKPQRRTKGNLEPSAGKIKLGPTGILTENQERAYKKKIYALHAFVIAPILFYVGWNGAKSNSHVWALLGAMAMLAAFYHVMRLIYPRETTSCPGGDEEEQEYLAAVGLLHIVIIAPLLGYVAWFGTRSNPRVWGALLGLGFFTFLYHGFRYFYPREVRQC